MPVSRGKDPRSHSLTRQEGTHHESRCRNGDFWWFRVCNFRHLSFLFEMLDSSAEVTLSVSLRIAEIAALRIVTDKTPIACRML